MISPKNFLVQIGDVIWKRHADQLKARLIPVNIDIRANVELSTTRKELNDVRRTQNPVPNKETEIQTERAEQIHFDEQNDSEQNLEKVDDDVILRDNTISSRDAGRKEERSEMTRRTSSRTKKDP